LKKEANELIFEIGLENGMEGRSMAWVFDHPACFAYGQDNQEALQNLPGSIAEYVGWLHHHNPQSQLTVEEIEIHLKETWEVYQIDENFELVNDGYEVNAWFLHDWKPLTEEEIHRGINLLSWSREDLLAVVKDLSQEDLKRRYPGERWNIAGILRHVGGAEWWYLDRLGLAFPRPEVLSDPFERLEKVRRRFLEALPELAGSKQVVGVEGELWSPRKMLRRAIWHERDHTFHIRKLI
jgi:predicted RNase H-like HicB family nuclease